MSRRYVEGDTLVEAIAEQAASQPDATALVMKRLEGSEVTFTYQSLLDAICKVSRWFDVQEGDLVIIASGYHAYIPVTFFGIMNAGGIPSIYPERSPRTGEDAYITSIAKRAAHYGVRHIVGTPEILAGLRDQVEGIQLYDIDDVAAAAEGSEGSGVRSPAPEGPAFMQFTSGSTGKAKAIVFEHDKVLNQVDATAIRFELDNDKDVFVSWLPLYHDMGLIGALLVPLMTGHKAVIMSNYHWARAPHIYLQAIDEHQATRTYMPNFGYIHCADNARPRYMEGVDLSSMRTMINGSEPVEDEAFDSFYERFAAHGLQPSVFVGGYGMAENVLTVSSSTMYERAHTDHIDAVKMREESLAEPVDATDDNRLDFVSVGKPLVNCTLQIVDDEGSPLPERHIGEIILQSDCMFSGYYQDEAQTEKVLRDGWYYTGDYGYLADEDLYITGRKKDIIVTGGENIYPQPIEERVGQHEAIYRQRAVVIGVASKRKGTEDIILIAEIPASVKEDQHEDLKREIRHMVANEFGVALSEVVLVPRRWIMMTSSGKVARQPTKAKYLANNKIDNHRSK